MAFAIVVYCIFHCLLYIFQNTTADDTKKRTSVANASENVKSACLVIFHQLLLSSADSFFKINSFRSTIRVQTVWIQIKTDGTSVLIWIRTVCRLQKSPLARKESKDLKSRNYILRNVNCVRLQLRVYAVPHTRQNAIIDRIIGNGH